eukprot:scaffold16424_cov61-Phaeocystis_antarctica.AAC.4
MLCEVRVRRGEQTGGRTVAREDFGHTTRLRLEAWHGLRHRRVGGEGAQDRYELARLRRVAGRQHAQQRRANGVAGQSGAGAALHPWEERHRDLPREQLVQEVEAAPPGEAEAVAQRVLHELGRLDAGARLRAHVRGGAELLLCGVNERAEHTRLGPLRPLEACRVIDLVVAGGRARRGEREADRGLGVAQRLHHNT